MWIYNTWFRLPYIRLHSLVCVLWYWTNKKLITPSFLNIRFFYELSQILQLKIGPNVSNCSWAKFALLIFRFWLWCVPFNSLRFLSSKDSSLSMKGFKESTFQWGIPPTIFLLIELDCNSNSPLILTLTYLTRKKGIVKMAKTNKINNFKILLLRTITLHANHFKINFFFAAQTKTPFIAINN